MKSATHLNPEQILVTTRARLMLLATAALACGPAGQPPDEVQSIRSGLSRADLTGFSPGGGLVWLSTTDRDRELDAMAATGAKRVRVDFPWRAVQAGGRDSWNWIALDAAVDAIHARGLRVLALPAYTPSWANGGHDDGTYAPLDGADWERFVYQAGRRYIPRGVLTWEMWNEPNLRTFWKPTPSRSGYVAKVLVPGARGIRRAAEETGAKVTVLTAGTAPSHTVDGNISPLDFVKGIYANGGRSSFDAVAHHPYTWPHAPTEPDASWNAMLQSSLIYDEMKAQGDGAKKIWATEVGYPTGDPTTQKWAVDEPTQAKRMRQVFAHWFSQPFAGPLLWYSLRDLSHDGTSPEDHFGVLRVDFQPKPAYSVFTELVSGCGLLGADKRLFSNESVTSCDGRFKLLLQTDGNVVLYDAAAVPLWSTRTHGQPAHVFHLQPDGNLVLRTEAGSVLWSSATYDHPGATLKIQNDGNAVIYDGSTAVWATDTCCH
jgi:hypothetical protein